MKKENGWFSDIILVDVINFSQLPALRQLEIITYLTKSYSGMIKKMLRKSNMPLNRLVLGFVSTGDGFFCILNPYMRGFGTILGLSFNHFSQHISKRYPYFEGLRVAVHSGMVYEFEDILGNKNFIGDGLNECSRYLEFKNYTISTVMISKTAYEGLKIFLKYNKDFQQLLIDMELKHSSFYKFEDKHGHEREGVLVWLRKAGIINPPKINFTQIL